MDNKELKNWNEYSSIREALDYITPPRSKVDVACPECGKQLWRRNDIILTSYPPQYKYECECGWTGYTFR